MIHDVFRHFPGLLVPILPPDFSLHHPVTQKVSSAQNFLSHLQTRGPAQAQAPRPTREATSEAGCRNPQGLQEVDCGRRSQKKPTAVQPACTPFEGPPGGCICGGSCTTEGRRCTVDRSILTPHPSIQPSSVCADRLQLRRF